MLGRSFARPVIRAWSSCNGLLLARRIMLLIREKPTIPAGQISRITSKYDHVVLAGASLSPMTNKLSDQGKTFRDHLQVAIDLHHIKRVVIMDHRDCGAYRTIHGEDFALDPANETQIHTKYLAKLSAKVVALYPDLAVETLLMNLDGTVEVTSA